MRLWGLNPTIAASSALVVPLAAIPSGKLAYTRRVPALTGLTHTIMTSTNLATWMPDPGAVQTVTATAANVQTVTVSVSPARLAGEKLFIKVQAAP